MANKTFYFLDEDINITLSLKGSEYNRHKIYYISAFNTKTNLFNAVYTGKIFLPSTTEETINVTIYLNEIIETLRNNYKECFINENGSAEYNSVNNNYAITMYDEFDTNKPVQHFFNVAMVNRYPNKTFNWNFTTNRVFTSNDFYLMGNKLPHIPYKLTDNFTFPVVYRFGLNSPADNTNIYKVCEFETVCHTSEEHQYPDKTYCGVGMANFTLKDWLSGSNNNCEYIGFTKSTNNNTLLRLQINSINNISEEDFVSNLVLNTDITTAEATVIYRSKKGVISEKFETNENVATLIFNEDKTVNPNDEGVTVTDNKATATTNNDETIYDILDDTYTYIPTNAIIETYNSTYEEFLTIKETLENVYKDSVKMEIEKILIPKSLTKCAIVDKCPSRYYLKWVDRFGGIQCQSFNGKFIFNSNYNTLTISNQIGRKRNINWNVTNKWTLNSGYISEDDYIIFESIFLSEYIQLYDTEQDKTFDVLVENTNYNEKHYKNEKKMLNFNLTVVENKTQKQTN